MTQFQVYVQSIVIPLTRLQKNPLSIVKDCTFIYLLFLISTCTCNTFLVVRNNDKNILFNKTIEINEHGKVFQEWSQPAMQKGRRHIHILHAAEYFNMQSYKSENSRFFLSLTINEFTELRY